MLGQLFQKIMEAKQPRALAPRVFSTQWSPSAYYNVLANITNIAASPTFIQQDPSHNSIWVSHGFPFVGTTGGSTVDQINTISNSKTVTVAVGGNPTGLALTPDETALWVVNSADKTISIVNTSTASVTQLISDPSQNYPTFIASTPLNTVWITNGDYANPQLQTPVVVVDIATTNILATVHTPTQSTILDLAIGPLTGGSYTIWFTDFSDRCVWLVNSTNPTPLSFNDRIFLPESYPTMITLSPDYSSAWITDTQNSTVIQINVATRQYKLIPVPSAPFGIAVDPLNNYVFVACVFGGAVAQIDIANSTVVNVIEVAGGISMSPLDIAVDSSTFWLTDIANNYVRRFPILIVPTFTVQGVSGIINYAEVTRVCISVNQGTPYDLTGLVTALGGAPVTYYSIYSYRETPHPWNHVLESLWLHDRNGRDIPPDLSGTQLSVYEDSIVVIEVRSAAIPGQSSGAILVDLHVSVIPPPVTIVCNGGFVRPNYVAQLSGTERTSIYSATTIYNAATLAENNHPKNQRPAFKSGADYIAYKKARILVSAKQPTVGGAPVRPPQTSLTLNPVPSLDCSGSSVGGGGGGGLGGGGGGGLGGGGGGLGGGGGGGLGGGGGGGGGLI